jgi:addiction module RelE/StbE family toxin
MLEIRFSPDALIDLQEIKGYITDDLQNETAAENTIRTIMDRIQQLIDFPDMGAPLSSVVQTQSDYRYLVCGNYTAFYRHEKETVFIVRVLYGRRDYMRVLFE